MLLHEYLASLKSHELHGLMLAEAKSRNAVQLCNWIRPRVRRSDFVGVHDGAVVVIVQKLRLVVNLDGIAARLIEAAEQDAAVTNLALHLGIIPFESDKALFDNIWREARSALQRPNAVLPYVVVRNAPRMNAVRARGFNFDLGVLQQRDTSDAS
jgi:hypothetical protein